MWEHSHVCCASGQETYFASDSTLRRFSSRHYKDLELKEVKKCPNLETYTNFPRCTLDLYDSYFISIITIFFLHFSLSICSFSIHVVRLALLTAGRRFSFQLAGNQSEKMSENRKPLNSHFRKHWHNGWLFPTVPGYPGASWRLWSTETSSSL